MTLEDSYRIFGLSSESSEDQRHQAYARMREKLESKKSKAPTPKLRKRYEDALSELDEAIELIELKVDAHEMPLFESSRPKDETSKTSPLGASGDRSESGRYARIGRFFKRPVVLSVAATLILACLGGGLWKWKLHQLEQEQIRILAEQEAARAAEVARLREKERQEEEQAQEKLKVELTLRSASLKTAVAKLDQEIELAKRRLEDLEGAERIAQEYGSSEEKSLAAFRKASFRRYLEQLEAYSDAFPARLSLNLSKDLERIGKWEEAIEAVAGITVHPAVVQAEAEKLKQEYDLAMTRYLAERDYATALKSARRASEGKDYAQAIALITPFTSDPHVGEMASEERQRLYERKTRHVYAAAQDAADLKEFDTARALLGALDGDPVFIELSEKERALIMTLNAEYAYEQTLMAVSEAANDGHYGEAKELLEHLVDDPYLGERSREEIKRIEAEIEKQVALRRSNADPQSVEEPGSSKADPESGLDIPPKIISKVSPDYPYSLKRQNISGYVELEWTIAQNGEASEIQAIESSHKAFVEPAIKALKQWKFEPARKDGHLVSTKVRQKMLFAP